MKVRRRTALGRVASLLAFAAVTLLLGLGVAPVTVRADAAQEDGIVVNLHDYDREDINAERHDMKFGDKQDNTFNEYTHGNQMFAEIVQRKLLGGTQLLITQRLTPGRVSPICLEEMAPAETIFTTSRM